MIENNCRIRISKAGITLEAEVNDQWKDVVLYNTLGLKNTTDSELKEFVEFVNSGKK